MDHLPCSSTNEFRKIKVPCLSLDNYDGDDFSTYLDRLGLNQAGLFVTLQGNNRLTDLLQERGISRKDYIERDFNLRSLPAIIQTWLYFGSLATVLNEAIVTKEFVIEDEEHGYILCTKELPKKLDMWKDRCRDTDSQERAAARDKLSIWLRDIDYFLQVIDETDACDLMIGEVRLAILCLVETLRSHARHVYNLPGLRLPTKPESLNLYEKMVEDGWCPFTANSFSKRLSIVTMYYLYTLGPPASGRNHAACSSEECVANQVDPRAFAPQHTTDCGGCQLTDVREEDLLQLLNDKETPIIWLEGKSEENLKKILRRASAQPDLRTRMWPSLIWADGCANIYDNALPRCQLYRLQRLANSLYENEFLKGNVPFWCDTLSIPTIQGPEKKTAISNMGRVYAEADKVIVLDREIESMKPPESNSDFCDLITRILTSSWTQRVWTLQEGALAKEVVFSASGFPVERWMIDQQLLANVLHGDETSIPMMLRHDLRSLRQEIIYAPDGDYKENLFHIWRAMQWRLSSINADRELCLATVLGLDASVLLDIPPHDRLAALFSMKDEWPAEILFLAGKRLANPGCRWIPDSFFSRQSAEKRFKVVGTRTADGLRIDSNELVMYVVPRFVLESTKQTYQFQDSHANWVFGTTLPAKLQKDDDERETERAMQFWSEMTGNECTVVIVMSRLPGIGKLVDAALGLVVRQQETTVVARYIKKVKMVGLPQELIADEEDQRHKEQQYFVAKEHGSSLTIG